MRWIGALVVLGACGDSNLFDGDQLRDSTLTGLYADRPFSPRFGYAYVQNDDLWVIIGTHGIGCDEPAPGSLPGEGGGMFASARVPPAVGVTNDAEIAYYLANNNFEDDVDLLGGVNIAAINGLEVTVTFAVGQTLNAARYEMNGSVTMTRCP